MHDVAHDIRARVRDVVWLVVGGGGLVPRSGVVCGRRQGARGHGGGGRRGYLWVGGWGWGGALDARLGGPNILLRREHLPELLQGRQAGRDAIESVHERDQLGAAQGGVLAVLVFVVLEQHFERGAVADRLQLAPQAALVAADAVHEPAHVAEAVAEVFFQREGPDRGVLEHEGFVENGAAGGGAVGEVEHFPLGGGVLGRVVGAEGVGLEVGAEFGYGA